MRKLSTLLLLPALAVALAGCSNDDNLGPVDGDGHVTFNISLGDVNPNSRASTGDLINTPTYEGDDLVNVVYVQAYDANGNAALQSMLKLPLSNGGVSTTIYFPSTGTYNVVFWAQDSTCEAYSLNNFPQVTAKYVSGQTNNDPSLTAFYANVPGVQPILLNNMTVTLKRAVAQVNVGMPYSDYTQMMATKRPNFSSVTFTGLPNTFNLLTGTTVSPNSNSTTTFALSKGIITQNSGQNTNPLTVTTASGDSTVTNNYAWLSMCYVLAPTDLLAVTKAEFTFQNATAAIPAAGNNPGTPLYSQSVVVDNLPITQNYRTNVIATLAGNIQFTVQTNFQWSGSQKAIVNLTADQFAALSSNEAADFGDQDVIVNLGGASIAAPSTSSTTSSPVMISCHNFLLENGTINNGSLYLLNTGSTTISNVKFTGSAGNSTSRITIGDASGVSGTSGSSESSVFSQIVNLNQLDFTGQTISANGITIDGGLAATTASAVSANQGTGNVQITNCNFANIQGDAIRMLGLRDSALVTISDCNFAPAYQNVNNSNLPGHCVNICNINDASSVDINTSNCTFNYVELPNQSNITGFVSTNAAWSAGFIGLSSYKVTIGSLVLNKYIWPMNTWTLKFLNIGYGTSTSSTVINALNPGAVNSILGLESGNEVGMYPTTVYLNTGNLTVDTSNYPTGYF
jgi:hypothetical protein